MTHMTMSELVEFTKDEDASQGRFYDRLRKERNKINARVAREQKKLAALQELLGLINGYI